MLKVQFLVKHIEKLTRKCIGCEFGCLDINNKTFHIYKLYLKTKLQVLNIIKSGKCAYYSIRVYVHICCIRISHTLKTNHHT